MATFSRIRRHIVIEIEAAGQAAPHLSFETANDGSKQATITCGLDLEMRPTMDWTRLTIAAHDQTVACCLSCKALATRTQLTVEYRGKTLKRNAWRTDFPAYASLQEALNAFTATLEG